MVIIPRITVAPHKSINQITTIMEKLTRESLFHQVDHEERKKSHMRKAIFKDLILMILVTTVVKKMVIPVKTMVLISKVIVIIMVILSEMI